MKCLCWRRWLEFRWLSPIDTEMKSNLQKMRQMAQYQNTSHSICFSLMYYCPIPKSAVKLTSIQIQVCIKILALYEENYGRGLKILFFVTLTKLVTARLHKRSSSTFGNLDRMLDWIYIEFAMVIHFWVLHLVQKVGVCESSSCEREKERERF